ncbi:hypothetical protein BC567DRAFT_83525 [Phyllosticta citribraziliensis]
MTGMTYVFFSICLSSSSQTLFSVSLVFVIYFLHFRFSSSSSSRLHKFIHFAALCTRTRVCIYGTAWPLAISFPHLPSLSRRLRHQLFGVQEVSSLRKRERGRLLGQVLLCRFSVFNKDWSRSCSALRCIRVQYSSYLIAPMV